PPELAFGGLVGAAPRIRHRLDADLVARAVLLHFDNERPPANPVRLGQDPVSPSVDVELSRHGNCVRGHRLTIWSVAPALMPMRDRRSPSEAQTRAADFRDFCGFAELPSSPPDTADTGILFAIG